MALEVAFPTIAHAQEVYRTQLSKERIFVPVSSPQRNPNVVVKLRVTETGGELVVKGRVIKVLDAATARKHGLGRSSGVVVAVVITEELKPPLRDLLTGKLRGTSILDEVTAWLSRAQDGTHYDVLGVPRGASHDEIRRSYLKLMKKFHPDNFFGRVDSNTIDRLEVAYQLVATAFQTLADGRARDKYDVAIGNFRDARGGTSAKVKRERARLEDWKRENAAGIRQAKQLWEDALKDEQAGRFKSARSKIRLAINFDPMNPAFKRKLDDLD